MPRLSHRPRPHRRVRSHAARALACAVLLGVPACISTFPSTGGGDSDVVFSSRTAEWPIHPAAHVDLWLHGFAVLQADTTAIPFFRRAYRDSIAAAKARLGVMTLLDANRERLSGQFVSTPSLGNAQFLALYFGSWDDLQRGARIFFDANGSAGSLSDRNAQRIVAAFATYFPTAAERDWLRLFLLSLDDERTKFYTAYRNDQLQQRIAVQAAIDSLWTSVVRDDVRRFAANSGQRRGEVLLSLPLEAEGRTVSEGGQTVIAVGFPRREGDAQRAIYTLAHEIVSSVTPGVIEDHITPAESRDGVGAQYQGAALVRGGEALLRRIAPDWVDGYARFYLEVAKVRFAGDPVVALSQAYPLPDAMVAGLASRIDEVLGGF